MAAPPLGADCCLDYLSIIHRNMYRMPIDPDHRMMLKKHLRLIDNELDANLGVPCPSSPFKPHSTYLAATTKEMSEFWAGQIENLETTAEIFFRLVNEKEGGDAEHPEYKHL